MFDDMVKFRFFILKHGHGSRIGIKLTIKDNLSGNTSHLHIPCFLEMERDR